VDPYEFQTFRVIYESVSAILCFILLRFMIKPYQLTKETRYLGLPLGFGFLGATYAVSALIYYQLYLFGNATIYFQLFLRSFAFVFLCVTYYFSRKQESSRGIWNITFTVLITAIIILFVILNIPNISLPSYPTAGSFTRVFNLICIFYLCAHTIRSHLEKPDPSTLWSPLAFILMGISQYSLIIYAMDNSYTAWFGALGIRWAALAIFFFVAYKSFRPTKKEGDG